MSAPRLKPRNPARIWPRGFVMQGAVVNVRECTCITDIDTALARLRVGLTTAEPCRAEVIRRYIDELLDKRNELADAGVA